MNSVEQTVEEIFDCCKKYGTAPRTGESVSQIDHMAQAAQLALREGFDDEIILAAFFHDIGHICISMNYYGVPHHPVKSQKKLAPTFCAQKAFLKTWPGLLKVTYRLSGT